MLSSIIVVIKLKKENIKQSKNTLVIYSVITLLVIFGVVSFFVKESVTENVPVFESSVSTTATTTTTTTTTTTETSTTETTTIESTVTESEVESTTKESSPEHFYDTVVYRSPTAEPADIAKHGRNLMLLNNDYELPEDFKWDLVYWKNGKSVDALSLNSQKYDSVDAVDRAAYKPLKEMFAAAEKDGVPLELVSAYRSISLQDRLFTRSVNSYMNQGFSKEDAIKKANYSRTFSGTSEHNTGLGFDILQKGSYYLTESFDKTEQFEWLIENAEDYGFILRYQKDKITITGIMYEPWHFRYVDVEHAKKINELGYCLEEYIDYLEAKK